MSNITRRQDLGLGKTAAGGSSGSFAAHSRETAGAPPASEPQLMIDQEVIDKLEDGCGDEEFGDELWAVAQSYVKSGRMDTDLVYVSYDDELRAEQIDMYLSGDPDAELEDEISELFSEQRSDREHELVDEMLEDWGADENEVSDSVKDRLREYVSEADTSDPVAALAKNTSSQLMRASIGQEGLMDGAHEWAKSGDHGFTYDDLYSGDSDKSEEARTAYIIDYLDRSGVDVSGLMSGDNNRNIRSLATEGPYYWHEGVRLDAIWYGDIADARASADPDRTRTIRLGGARMHSRDNQEGKTNIVLLDAMNGSGYDAQLDIPLSITVDSDRPAHLDSGGSAYGYGWDDTAGVHKPAYGVDVNDASTEYDEQKYERDSDGRLTKRGQQQASADIDAALSAKHRELSNFQRKYERFDRSSVSEQELDRLDGQYNQLHDDITDLRFARRETQINRGYVREYSHEWLVANNID